MLFFKNFHKIFGNFSILVGWLQRPARPPGIFGWGGKALPDLPLNGRPQHLIEAAKRGRLDQMIFSVPLTIRAPLTTRAPVTTVRRPEAKCTSAASRMPSFNFLQPTILPNNHFVILKQHGHFGIPNVAVSAFEQGYYRIRRLDFGNAKQSCQNI